jgi:exopolyphosphatase/guanosine-5'-triphosphate,3'-diphosphate pyrophosphatase
VSASSEEGTAAVAHEPIEPVHGRRRPAQRVYAALDLGTNNCRLLIARPEERGFKVVDAFSRIVRLGEGVGASGLLSDAAMDRAIDALDNCQRKLVERGVSRFRLIATEACRAAVNGPDFIDRVQATKPGWRSRDRQRARPKRGSRWPAARALVDRDAEARAAVRHRRRLVGTRLDGPVRRGRLPGRRPDRAIRAWASLPVGVVTLAERFGGHEVDATIFEAMVADVAARIAAFRGAADVDRAAAGGRVHLLGTSGTVTTLAGVHLGLERYDRRRVDGLWLASADVDAMVARIRAMSHAERVASPCIGYDRADLVIAGCAILEAIRRRWPCERLRVADRGLREGILSELIAADRYGGYGERDGWS